MKSILLKLLIVATLFGAIIITTILLVDGKDTEKKTYEVIKSEQQTVDIDKIITESRTVKNSTGALDYNEYSRLVSSSMKELQEGIDYYLNYIPQLDELTNKNRKNLVELNETYVEYIKVAVKRYDYYKELANATSPNTQAIRGASADFTLAFNEAYQKGMILLNELVDVIEKDAYDDYASKSWVYISFESVNILGSKLSEDVATQMQAQKTGGTVVALTNNSKYQLFTQLVQMYDTERETAKDMSVLSYSTFVNNYNKIKNVTSFWVDPVAYRATLTGEANEKEYTAVNGVIYFLKNVEHLTYFSGVTA